MLLGQGYSHTCDVWSFGVVCWELSTARIPFDGMSLVLVARKVTRTQNPTPNPHPDPNPTPNPDPNPHPHPHPNPHTHPHSNPRQHLGQVEARPLSPLEKLHGVA